VADIFY